MLLRTSHDSGSWVRSFPRRCGLRYCKHFSICVSEKRNPSKVVLVPLTGGTFVYVKACSVGTSEFGQCKTQTVLCRLNTERIKHVLQIVFHRELTLHRQTGEYIQPWGRCRAGVSGRIRTATGRSLWRDL